MFLCVCVRVYCLCLNVSVSFGSCFQNHNVMIMSAGWNISCQFSHNEIKFSQSVMLHLSHFKECKCFRVLKFTCLKIAIDLTGNMQIVTKSLQNILWSAGQGGQFVIQSVTLILILDTWRRN